MFGCVANILALHATRQPLNYTSSFRTMEAWPRFSQNDCCMHRTLRYSGDAYLVQHCSKTLSTDAAARNWLCHWRVVLLSAHAYWDINANGLLALRVCTLVLLNNCSKDDSHTIMRVCIFACPFMTLHELKKINMTLHNIQLHIFPFSFYLFLRVQ